MSNVAADYDIVIGVDTHEDFHVAAIVDARTAGELHTVQFEATDHGYQELMEVLDRFPALRAWAIEGTASHGIGLTRFLIRAQEQVFEVDRPNRSKRKHGAKSDVIDALRAAREALGAERLATPKDPDGPRAELQLLLTARRLRIAHATDTERQLRSFVNTAPEAFKARFRGLSLPQMVKKAALLRGSRQMTPLEALHVDELRQLAKNAQELRAQATALERRIRAIVQAWMPGLLTIFGVGPIVAATVLTVWSHPGRVHSEAALAMLAGTAPIPASSGKQSVPGRHRLNRSGDRHLNSAIYTIVLARWRHDPRTKAYIERRLAEGKTPREIRRILKRYVTRELYKHLENAA